MLSIGHIKEMFCQFGNSSLTLFSAPEDNFDFYKPLPKRFRENKELFRQMFSCDDTKRLLCNDNLWNYENIVTIQLRRGDFGKGKYWIPPNRIYIDWLDSFFWELEYAVLYISSDEPDKVVGDFAKFQPVTCSDIHGLSNKTDSHRAFADLVTISKSDYVAISNSSFGFVGCMLNEKGRFFRPLNGITEFDPWTDTIVYGREVWM